MKTAFLIPILASAVSCSRISTALSVERISDRDDFNLYAMDVKYSYDLDSIISKCGASDESYIKAVLDEVMPFIDAEIAVPDFACSAFSMLDTSTLHRRTGRTYDFGSNTSAMLVKCTPDNGYSSVALAALNNIGADRPDSSLTSRIVSLTAPFACVDGINEKGVCISVLSLDSEPTRQNTGKPVLYTSMAVRLVLDRAASTEEAVGLLNRYDMFAAANSDYHFYITDPSGDARVVEFDPEKENRDIVAIKSPAVTNFYVMYRDSVQPYHTAPVFTHGRDRYNAIDSVFATRSGLSEQNAWEALKAVSRTPDLPYSTQWAALYDNTSCGVSVVMRSDWENSYSFTVPVK